MPDGVAKFENGLEHFNPEELTKVEKLCVYWENMGTAQDHYDLWLVWLLGTFGGVKNFKAITKHSMHSVWERDLTESERWDLAMIEPIDIKVASLHYESNSHEEAPLDGINPDTNWTSSMPTGLSGMNMKRARRGECPLLER